MDSTHILLLEPTPPSLPLPTEEDATSSAPPVSHSSAGPLSSGSQDLPLDPNPPIASSESPLVDLPIMIPPLGAIPAPELQADVSAAVTMTHPQLR
ncbi:unnamed protein product [Calypogeia fissa]